MNDLSNILIIVVGMKFVHVLTSASNAFCCDPHVQQISGEDPQTPLPKPSVTTSFKSWIRHCIASTDYTCLAFDLRLTLTISSVFTHVWTHLESELYLVYEEFAYRLILQVHPCDLRTYRQWVTIYMHIYVSVVSWIQICMYEMSIYMTNNILYCGISTVSQ
jgi:hypothetical protein